MKKKLLIMAIIVTISFAIYYALGWNDSVKDYLLSTLVIDITKETYRSSFVMSQIRPFFIKCLEYKTFAWFPPTLVSLVAIDICCNIKKKVTK